MSDNYIYHPLGDYAKYYEDGTIGVDDIRYPRAHLEHDYGGIDFFPGSKIPVYAMTDGKVVCIAVYNSDTDRNNNCAGYVVEEKINSEKTGYKENFYIRYMCLGWLSPTLAESINLKGGTTGTYYDKIDSVKNSVEISISEGDIIGYTNAIGQVESLNKQHCQLHIDFQKKETILSGLTAEVPFKLNSSNFGSCFTVKNDNWYQNNVMVGSIVSGNGYVPDGENNDNYKIYNHYLYCMLISKPSYIDALSGDYIWSLENNIDNDEKVLIIYPLILALADENYAGFGKNLAVGAMGNMYGESPLLTDCAKTTNTTIENLGGGIYPSDYPSWANRTGDSKSAAIEDFRDLLGYDTINGTKYRSGFGIFQFTGEDNIYRVFRIAEEKNKPITSLQVQLLAMIDYMYDTYGDLTNIQSSGTYGAASWNFIEQNDISNDKQDREAATFFMARYERPSKSCLNWSTRKEGASTVATLLMAGGLS